MGPGTRHARDGMSTGLISSSLDMDVEDIYNWLPATSVTLYYMTNDRITIQNQT